MKAALTKAKKIVICLAPGDLNRCAEDKDDFFGFELQTALCLGEKGTLIYPLLRSVSPETLLPSQILKNMDRNFNRLGTKLKDWLISHKRYDVNLGVPGDGFSQLMDSIVGKAEIKSLVIQ